MQETDDSDGDNDDVYFTNAMRAKADSLQKIQDLNFGNKIITRIMFTFT